MNTPIQKRSETKSLTASLLLCATCVISLSACTGAGIGILGIGPQFADEDAYALILHIYSELNYYGMRYPGTYASGSVVVSEDRNNDYTNAYYATDVTIAFSEYSSGAATIDGTGLIEAYMDSAEGKYGATYSGTLTGTYNGENYKLKMNYTAENAAGVGITSSGSFTLNRKEYEMSVDDMLYVSM